MEGELKDIRKTKAIRSEVAQEHCAAAADRLKGNVWTSGQMRD